MEPLLRVNDLSVTFTTPLGTTPAVSELSFEVHAGETLCIVGESGSGKSVTALSVLGILAAPPAAITGGEIWFEGHNLLALKKRELDKIRGARISMIFQDPMTSLNPVMPIGRQIAEVITRHRFIGRGRAVEAAVADLLRLVGIPDAAGLLRCYPHECSGGMRQRVMIAMAVANKPALLLADEPTTALDVTIQAQILEVLADVQREVGMAVVLITHDLGVVAERADRVVVMYAGRVMESARVADLFEAPSHPYTAALMASLPDMNEERDRLPVIPGQPPSAGGARYGGCPFQPRCAVGAGREVCRRSMPPLSEVAIGHLSACHFSAEVSAPTGPATSSPVGGQ